VKNFFAEYGKGTMMREADFRQRTYLNDTEGRIRLMLEYLRTEPEGIRRKELLEMCGIPTGSATGVVCRLHDAGLIRVMELPAGGRYRGRTPHLVIPTDKLLGMTIDEAMEEVAKTYERWPGRRGSKTTTKASTKASTKAVTKSTTKALPKVVVSRHNALVEYMREIGLIDETTPVYSHVRASMIEGKHVFGALPLHLMAVAAKITVIPLRNLPYHLRGQELSLEEIRMYAGPPATYEVRAVETEI